MFDSSLHGLAILQFLRPVACRALLRCRFVEQHHLCVHRLHQFVATFAAHVAMDALQWKRRPLVVIEQRRLPLRAVVAVRARRNVIRRPGKLRTVHVLVALFTLERRALEVHILEVGTHIRRLVAVDAGHSPVRAD